jgi:hypothetical protein
MRTLLVIFFILSAVVTQAQRDIDENTGWALKDRIYVGGGFGLNGGTDYGGNKYFTFSLSPIVGYMITPNFSAGTGITYQYLAYSDINVKLHQYGFSPFVRYNVKQFFGQVEYNIISTPYAIQISNSSYEVSERRAYDRLLVGLGIAQPIGERSKINLLAMYDFLYSNDRTKSPFASPWVFRVFFSI